MSDAALTSPAAGRSQWERRNSLNLRITDAVVVAAALGSSSFPCYAAPRSGDLQASAPDATKAERELGWRPTVDLADGIERTMCWLRIAYETGPGVPIGA